MYNLKIDWGLPDIAYLKVLQHEDIFVGHEHLERVDSWQKEKRKKNDVNYEAKMWSDVCFRPYFVIDTGLRLQLWVG